jgi:hypothetical protein
MSTIKFAKVATLPATLAPSTVYMVAPTGSSIDELQIYVSSNDGLSSRHIPTHNEIATMISTAVNSYSSAVVVADVAARNCRHIGGQWRSYLRLQPSDHFLDEDR